MRELEISHRFKEKTEQVRNVQRKNELRLKEKIRPHKNHCLFEYDLETNEMRKAEFHKGDYLYRVNWVKGDERSGNFRVIIKDNCIYISAMNIENAWKHLKNRSNGSRITTKQYEERLTLPKIKKN